MRALLAVFTLIVLVLAARAGPVASEYTRIDTETDCTVFAAAGADEGGDWANLVCSGYRGYPVLIYYGDARESVFYGFPPQGDAAPAWESFSPFNSSGPTVEWRIETDGARKIPFATIHRWFVSASTVDDSQTEVLVVERVGQIHDRAGCVVGYVVATGNPGANDAARRIADERARGFSCGRDEPVVDEGSVPAPPATRVQN